MHGGRARIGLTRGPEKACLFCLRFGAEPHVTFFLFQSVKVVVVIAGKMVDTIYCVVTGAHIPFDLAIGSGRC